MRIALFGGTFDPIHNGHLLLAEATREQYRLDRVIFVPAGQPPHKRAPEASISDRIAMLRAAIRGHTGFALSDWEVRQKRIVYTYETLAHFEKMYGRHVGFVIGADSLQQIRLWRRGEELLRRYTFYVADRPDIVWSKIPARDRKRVRRVTWPAVPFASHEIRAACRRGRSIRYQVPAAVEAYIRRRRLYRA